MLSDTQIERYSRQIILPQIGGRGQAALLSATVAISGSGDMATTAGLYLAAAGIGCLRASASTAAAIGGMNADCHVVDLGSNAVSDMVHGAAAVLSAGGDPVTCAAIGAACAAADVPWLVADVTDATGWLCICHAADAPCIRCVAQAIGAPRCGTTPLGQATAGLIGTLLATEAMKAVLKLRSAVAGRRLVFDALSGDLRDEAAPTDPDCPTCARDA